MDQSLPSLPPVNPTPPQNVLSQTTPSTGRRARGLIVFVIVLIVLGGGAYWWYQRAPQAETAPAEITGEITAPEETPGLPEATAPVAKIDSRLPASFAVTETGTKYENFLYGFSLDFPKTWGEMIETVEPIIGNSKVLNSFRIAGKSNPSRLSLIVHVLSKGETPDPEFFDNLPVFLGEKDEYTFYYNSSLEEQFGYKEGQEKDEDFLALQAEIEVIVKTFKELE